MPDLKSLYVELQTKKREKNEIGKMIRDALTQDEEHRKITEELKTLREKKKSIENRVKADCLSDVEKMDDLKYEIATANDHIADVALTMYAEGETVEIVDEEGGFRLTPVFSVKFTKEEMERAEVKANEERAKSHPERIFKS